MTPLINRNRSWLYDICILCSARRDSQQEFEIQRDTSVAYAEIDVKKTNRYDVFQFYQKQYEVYIWNTNQRLSWNSAKLYHLDQN